MKKLPIKHKRRNLKCHKMRKGKIKRNNNYQNKLKNKRSKSQLIH